MNKLTSLMYYNYLLFLFCIPTFITSQVQKLTSANENAYFEELILNTDRTLYIVGEKIWFKANYIDTNNDTAEIISNILYIELYDSNNKTIAKEKFRIVENIATGFINIPENIPTGNYYLRIYSQFLRNYSPHLYPTKLISIINPERNSQNEKLLPDDFITITPDNQKLIAGLSSKTAIRIHSSLFKKVEKAIVYDVYSKDTINLTTYANGLALIELTPLDSSSYWLKLYLLNGDSVLRQFPDVVKKGTLLTSDYNGFRLSISLLTNDNKTINSHQDYQLELMSERLNSFYTEKININETIRIPGNQVYTGLNYILLKDKENKTIAVKNIFINNKEVGEIEIKKSKNNYKTRELVELDIDYTQELQQNRNFTISVIKKGTTYDSEDLLPVEITYNPVLLSNYLKTSHIKNKALKNQIEAALILNLPNINTIDFIAELEKEIVIDILPEIRDISLSGKIINSQTKKPLENIVVYASVFGNNEQLHMYRTNVEGEFLFSLNHLSKTQNIYICTEPLDSIKPKILINNDFSNKFPPAINIPLSLDSSNYELIEKLYINSQITKGFENHTTKTKQKITFSPLFKDNPAISIALIDYIKIPLMLEIFNEIVPFVSTRKKDDTYYFNVFDDRNKENYMDPLVLIDGVPFFNINQILNISPELVDKIDLINRLYYLGGFILNGIINVRTKTQNFAGVTFPEESVFIEFQTVSDEYSPVFQVHDQISDNCRIPDFRNLIYWDPYLGTGNRKEKLSFFTPDNYGDFEVVVKGYKNGQLFYGKTNFSILKK